jgi:hypothetical protein
MSSLPALAGTLSTPVAVTTWSAAGTAMICWSGALVRTAWKAVLVMTS